MDSKCALNNDEEAVKQARERGEWGVEGLNPKRQTSYV